MAGRGDVEPSGFGAMLRQVRDEKGVTQAALAAIAGLHPNTVAKLERGDQEPNWPVVLKLAKALGVDCTAFNAAAEPPPDLDRKPAPPAKKIKGGSSRGGAK